MRLAQIVFILPFFLPGVSDRREQSISSRAHPVALQGPPSASVHCRGRCRTAPLLDWRRRPPWLAARRRVACVLASVFARWLAQIRVGAHPAQTVYTLLHRVIRCPEAPHGVRLIVRVRSRRRREHRRHGCRVRKYPAAARSPTHPCCRPRTNADLIHQAAQRLGWAWGRCRRRGR